MRKLPPVQLSLFRAHPRGLDIKLVPPCCGAPLAPRAYLSSRISASRRTSRPCCSLHSAQQPSGGPDTPPGRKKDDEPEAFVLFVACAIGIGTGAGVVAFNLAIHAIQVQSLNERREQRIVKRAYHTTPPCIPACQALDGFIDGFIRCHFMPHACRRWHGDQSSCLRVANGRERCQRQTCGRS